MTKTLYVTVIRSPGNPKWEVVNTLPAVYAEKINPGCEVRRAKATYGIDEEDFIEHATLIKLEVI